jgi:hypothetical protein
MNPNEKKNMQNTLQDNKKLKNAKNQKIPAPGVEHEELGRANWQIASQVICPRAGKHCKVCEYIQK